MYQGHLSLCDCPRYTHVRQDVSSFLTPLTYTSVKYHDSANYPPQQPMNAVRCPSCGAPAGGSRFCGTCGMRLSQPSTATSGQSSPAGGRSAPHPPGTILDRRYRIVGALAAGAMGAVYKAEDLRLGGRPRALKELLQNWGTEAERGEAEAWFRREGETLMSLQHPAIPLVHDTFSEGSRHYLVMDLVEGRSL